MGQKLFGVLLMVLLACIAYASQAAGAVLLAFSGSSATIIPGGIFDFQMKLEITGFEQITGYDYYFGASGPGYNADFVILNRTSWLTNFPDLNSPDNAVATSPSSILDSVNELSLGASVRNPFEPVNGAGIYLLADFTLFLTPSALAGEYIIRPVFANWFNQNFESETFISQDAFTVTVVPESSPHHLLEVASVLIFISRFRCLRDRFNYGAQS